MFVIMNVAESIVRCIGTDIKSLCIHKGNHDGEYVGRLVVNNDLCYDIWNDGHFEEVTM